MSFRPEESASRLAAIVASSDDAIVSKDLNGVITSWNAAAERMFGWTAAEAIGKPITIIIPNDRQDEENYVLSRIRQQMRIRALLEVWLYVHVPLTFALIAALAAHIVSVFFYW